LVPLNTLTDDYYSYHENNAPNFHRPTLPQDLQPGTTHSLLVDRIDPVEKKIQFAILEERRRPPAQAKKG